MKKVLCYLAIVVLILLISVPPLIRVLYPKVEEKPIVIEKYSMLTCTKDSYTINESYKNDKALSIKFTRLLDDQNLEVSNDNNALEFVLDNELKKIVNANIVDEQAEIKMISYLLQYNNVTEESLVNLSDYRLPLENQLTHYQAHGYTCETIEQ